MLCKPVASIILHTAAFLIAGNQQLLVRSLVSLLLVPMASLLPTTHILSLHRTEKRKRIWKRGYTRFRLVRSGRTSKLFSCFYLNFFFFCLFLSFLMCAILLYSLRYSIQRVGPRVWRRRIQTAFPPGTHRTHIQGKTSFSGWKQSLTNRESWQT